MKIDNKHIIYRHHYHNVLHCITQIVRSDIFQIAKTMNTILEGIFNLTIPPLTTLYVVHVLYNCMCILLQLLPAWYCFQM